MTTRTVQVVRTNNAPSSLSERFSTISRNIRGISRGRGVGLGQRRNDMQSQGNSARAATQQSRRVVNAQNSGMSTQLSSSSKSLFRGNRSRGRGNGNNRGGNRSGSLIQNGRGGGYRSLTGGRGGNRGNGNRGGLRGGLRGTRGGLRGNGNRGGSRGGRGGRGRGGSRGGRGGRTNLSAGQLDQELAEYMGKSETYLDQELTEYFKKETDTAMEQQQ